MFILAGVKVHGRNFDRFQFTLLSVGDMPELKEKKKKKSGKSNWKKFNEKKSAERRAERERKEKMKTQPIQDDTTEDQKEAENKEPAEEVMDKEPAEEVMEVEAKQPARMPSRPTKQIEQRTEQPGFVIGAFFPTKGCMSCDTGMNCPGIRHSAKCLRENNALGQPQPPVLLVDEMAEFY